MTLRPPLPPGSKVLVGLSGGVDSSVAAALLQEQGYDVTGGFIKNWSDSKDLWTGECQWRAERRDALRVAARLGLSLLTFDFEARYRERVLDAMFAGYQAGQTPNPDILCNEAIKFGLFFEEARRLGFDGVATGHYARSSLDAAGAHLWKGIDPLKDQSYFLQRMPREALARALFPVGHLHKPQVRAEARRFGLPTAEKPDSQGICFLGKVRFDEFLRHYLGVSRGDLIEYETGKKIGEHDGFWYFTIGQRKGIKLSGGPWFVVAKDAKKNEVFISNASRGAEGARKTFDVENMNWIAGTAPEKRVLDVKIRHGESRYPCRIRLLRANRWRVRLDESQPGVAPGQFAVLYDGKECLGGGVIC